MFTKRGYILIPTQGLGEDDAMNVAIEAGAEDFSTQGGNYEIMTAPESFDGVLAELKGKGLEPTTAEVSMVPQNYVKLEGKPAQQMIRLMDALEDHDDVQNVHANFDIEESELAGVM
jgi:transcriptional/translational regulatory protein YebC/TACO1